MRPGLTTLLLSIWTATFALGQEADHRLLGTWELVSADYGSSNQVLTSKEVKFISKRHFAWIRYDKDGTTMGEGGGTYTASGRVVVEHLDYIDQRESFLKGQEQKVAITFHGEQVMISSGTLSSGQRITEVWRRLE